jgi:hypothetical protein
MLSSTAIRVTPDSSCPARCQLAPEHRYPSHLTQPGEQHGVEQEADEDGGHDLREAHRDATVARRVSARNILDRVDGGLPGEALGGDRQQVRGQCGTNQRGAGVGDDAAQRLQVELGGEQQHADHDGGRDQRCPQRQAPARPQLLSQLRHRHELESQLLAGVEDLGKRLDRLRAVVAVARAVGVVQQHDRARVEGGHAAIDDPLDAGLCGIPDSGRPAHHAVAQPSRHGHEERAAEPVRRAEQRRRRSAGRSHHRLVQRAQLVGDLGRPLEGEQPVVVAVAGQLVPLLDDAPGDLRVGAHLPAQAEEGRPHVGGGQRIQDGRRELGAGPVVERDRRHRRRHLAAADHLAEQRGVGGERGPCEHQHDQRRGGEEQVAEQSADRDRQRRRAQEPGGGGGYEDADDLALAHTGRVPAIRSA